jgi:hypothetical protein
MLDLDVVAAFTKLETGKKYLVNPSKGLDGE